MIITMIITDKEAAISQVLFYKGARLTYRGALQVGGFKEPH